MSEQPKNLLNKYSTRLYIDVDTYQNNNIANNFVDPKSTIKNIELSDIEVFDVDDDTFRYATDEELNEIVYPFNEITISTHNFNKTFTSKSEDGFTTKELFYNIIEHEKESRPLTDWFGGIDAHHIFFEGLDKRLDGSYSVFWGS